MIVIPYKIPPDPPLRKGGVFESPPFVKGDLGRFFQTDPLIQQY